MTNEQLKASIGLLNQGDKIAFEEIYKELGTPAFTIILRIVKNREVAEDILQEMFVKLYQSPPQPSITNPRAYIFQMARNLAIDGLRRQKQFIDITEIENDMHHVTEDFTRKLCIEDALNTLQIVESQIITLHINGGMTFREIAKMIKMPLGTVLWKYQKALGKLRISLEGTEL